MINISSQNLLILNDCCWFFFPISVEQNIAQWHNCTKYVNKPGFSNCICHFCGYGHNPYDECLKQGSSDVDFKKHKVYLMRVVATDGKMISETKNFSVALTPELGMHLFYVCFS